MSAGSDHTCAIVNGGMECCFYRIPEWNFNPKPIQPGGPKIIIGANAPIAIERAARIADGFNPDVRDLSAFEQSAARFREAAKAAGKDPAAMTIVIRTNSRVSNRNALDTRFLSGTIEKIADDLHQLDHDNVDEVFFDFNHFGMPVPDQLRAIEALQRAVT